MSNQGDERSIRPSSSDCTSRPEARWATDADGTLWEGDIGDDFLVFLCNRGEVPSSAVDRYERLLHDDEVRAFAWCAEAFGGLAVDRVEALADEFAAEWVPPRMWDWIAGPLSTGMPTMVVSASPAPVVRAGCRVVGQTFGVDWPRGVVGVETAHVRGIYRPELAGPVTWREAKVEALQRRGWDRWTLGSGDAWGDAQLLGQADRPLVVVHARSHPTWLEHAQTQGWEQVRPGRRLTSG